MSEIVVDLEKLSDYSKLLTETADDFSKIVSNMSNIISSVKTDKNWTGVDSENFVSKVNEYIESLNSVRTSLIDNAKIIDKQKELYDDRCKEFNSKIGG